MSKEKTIKFYAEHEEVKEKIMKHEIPEYITKYAVADCKSVEEFAYKYRKIDRFTQRGDDYVAAIMESHNEELDKWGYTCISHHDNVTGRFISYIEEEIV